MKNVFGKLGLVMVILTTNAFAVDHSVEVTLGSMEKNKTDSYGVIPFVGLGGTYEAATKLNDNLIGFISAGMDYTLGTDPVTTNPMPVFSANTTAGVRYKIGEHVQLGGGLKISAGKTF